VGWSTFGLTSGLLDHRKQAWAIAAILTGLMVFRRFREKVFSRTVIIVVSAFSGILGWAIVVGAIVLCIAV